ncbi:glycoside hydrolase family 16 protein [Psychromonas ossibalaenae]|uniref:glycoside hydrolase family 16 protein n=1 Tax=Psychromonas ossibalaenae TaxID=444922 RepID=UPI00035EBDA5|nr:glycoside hydrolase family 16 protein [Psychromonas ossibalaenae]
MEYKLEEKQDFLSRKIKYRTILIGMPLLCLTAPALAGWQVQWIDKFNGSSVNWDNWTAQTQANYNNEVQCYTDDDSSAERNYDVSNGTLKIIARKKNISCPGLGGAQKSWTSGRLNGKDKSEFLYGRIESRIRYHNLEGGTWPAFWMLENRIQEQPYKNDNDFSHWPNPGAGEIDVWEWFSNRPDSYITNFFNAGSDCGFETLHHYTGGAPDVLDWHNYALEWTKDEISFYIDERLVVSQDVSNCSQYEEPMFVLLNVAIGGMLGGSIDPALQKATMEVDYIAHCTATDENNAGYCNESTPSSLSSDSSQAADDDQEPADEQTVDTLPVSDNQDNSQSGGSMNSSLLWCLGLIGLFRRQRRAN